MVKRLIYERHRHRYEFNNEYRKTLTDAWFNVYQEQVLMKD